MLPHACVCVCVQVCVYRRCLLVRMKYECIETSTYGQINKESTKWNATFTQPVYGRTGKGFTTSNKPNKVKSCKQRIALNSRFNSDFIGIFDDFLIIFSLFFSSLKIDLFCSIGEIVQETR